MHGRNVRALAAFRRVLAFLDGREHAVALGSMTPHVDALQAVVRQLELLGERQREELRRARAATARAQALRTELQREYLVPLAAIGGQLAAGTSARTGSFVRARSRAASALLRHASLAVAAAAHHRQALVALGVAPDASDRLREAMLALRAALDDRAVARRASARTTAEIERCARSGRALVRILGTLTTARLDAVEAAVWRAAARVERTGRRDREGGGREPQVDCAA